MNHAKKFGTILALAAFALGAWAGLEPRPMEAAAVITPLRAEFMAPSAQANLTNTTLAAAITNASVTQVNLSSNTGVVAASGSNVNTYLIVDDELMFVDGQVGTSTTWNVTRGMQRTYATSHNNSAVVLVVSAGAPQQIFDNFVRGSCTASSNSYLPRIVISAGLQGTKRVYFESCTGPANAQIWREQTPLGDTTPMNTKYCTVPVGSVAYGSFGNTTTDVAGAIWTSTLYVPQTKQLTGLQILNGTVGSDKWILALYDAAGNLLANTATAGVAAATNNAFQQIPFTSTYIATGPSTYTVALQGNGTTDTFRTQAASTFVDTLAGEITGGTFGTLPSITVPTTFTANDGPIMCTY